MKIAIKDNILKKISDNYLNENGFTGYASGQLESIFNISIGELNKIVIELIKDEKVEVRFGIFHPNAYIKALPEFTDAESIKKLKQKKTSFYCLYPSRKYLEKILKKENYEDRPFSLRLALGANQLDFEAFEPSILDFYRNDPRYHFSSTESHGRIYLKDDNELEKGNDDFYLKDFGFCFSEIKRAVAVPFMRLKDLNSKHQQLWYTQRLDGDFVLHPEFKKIAYGIFDLKISIFQAFLEEQRIINKICSLLKYPNLFTELKNLEAKTNHFTYLLKPTLKDYEAFTHIFDKLLSERLNYSFFKSIELEKEEINSKGKVIVRKKGTIELLEEWLNKFYNSHRNHNQVVKVIIDPIRKVRKLRQDPGHNLNENKYDLKYFEDQNNLVLEVYVALRTLKDVLLLHPLLPKIDKDDFEIDSSNIYTF